MNGAALQRHWLKMSGAAIFIFLVSRCVFRRPRNRAKVFVGDWLGRRRGAKRKMCVEQCMPHETLAAVRTHDLL